MSPTLRPPEEVRLKRTAMSTRELRRAEVLGRVKSQTLRLVDAAKMLELSYRQTKRLWKRYRGEGAKGLQHRSAGRGSTERSQRNSGGRCCSSSGRSIQERNRSGLGPRWQRNIWRMRTGWKWARRRCDA